MSSLLFKAVTLQDVDVIRNYLYKEKSHCSDYSIGIAVMWKDALSLEYAISDDMLFMKAKIKGTERFYMPCGSGKFKDAIDKIIDYCNKKEIPLRFMSIAEEHIGKFEENYEVNIFQDRDYSDYIYASENLINLKGRKYHKKRNHISNFKKKYPDYKVLKITEENICKVQVFFEEYSDKYPAKDSSEEMERKCALFGLNHFKELGFIGACLEISGKVVAFTLGEVKNDMLIVHVEKADREYDGAYAVINNEFARLCGLNYPINWINREDDSGEEGLRKAKLSYYPDHIALKSKVEILCKV